MRRHGVRCLLMGGQACVFYGAAEFSRDVDLVILAEPENLRRLQTALYELKAAVIAIPAFEESYLHRGLEIHFRCQALGVEGLRIDVMTVMRGVDPFPELWERRTTITIKAASRPRSLSDSSVLPTDLMRPPLDILRLNEFMAAMGEKTKGPGRIYLTGGATALLHGWRPMTVDVDIKADPEPAGFFEAIASLKDELSVNIELASPSDFIPELPNWRERSLFIARHCLLDFYHYDPYGQALSKLERGHSRDQADVEAMLRDGLIKKILLLKFFTQIEPMLIRYPSLDPKTFREVVESFCDPAPLPKNTL